jgi:hypothetical protein
MTQFTIREGLRGRVLGISPEIVETVMTVDFTSNSGAAKKELGDSFLDPPSPSTDSYPGGSLER